MNWKSVLLLLLVPLMLFAEPWRVDIEWVTGRTHSLLTFGSDPVGTDGYNDGLDVLIPLPTPGDPNCYFMLDDPSYPYLSMLQTDIRSDQSDSLHYEIATSAESNITFRWNIATLPQGTFLFAPAYPPGFPAVYTNMRETNEVVILPGQRIHIIYEPTEYRTSNPPYITSFSPEDGEIGISPITSISFIIRDNETGLNFNEFSVYLNDENISSLLTITPIEFGYHVYYIPSEPLAGNTLFTLTVHASDFAYPPHSIVNSISFRTGAPLNRALWEIPLWVWTRIREDSTTQLVSLGVSPDASDGYDLGYDSPIPTIPPGVPFAYFPLTDEEYPFIRLLSRDIRSSDVPAHIWRVKLDNSGTISGVTWDRNYLPTDWVLYIAKSNIGVLPPDTVFVDMRNLTHLEFGRSEEIYIRANVPGNIDWYAPRVIDWQPADRATNVLVTTSISCTVIDPESGVNPESIRMWVNGLEVTRNLNLEETENGYDITYTPPTQLPFLSRINVILTAADNSFLSNVVTDTITFTTGSILSPSWAETLYINVQPAGQNVITMELIFGTDELGTDGIDLLLDQILPPPPPYGPYAFFFIDDSIWNALGQDVRSSFDNDILWRGNLFYFPMDESGRAWVTWNSNGLPAQGNFTIAVNGSEGEIRRTDMRENEEISLIGAYTFTIHYFVGVPEYCLNGTVALDNNLGDLSGTVVRVLDTDFTDTTDALGMYDICNIPEGTYTLSFTHTGYNPVFMESVSINQNTTINISLTPIYYTVSGRVTLEGLEDGQYFGSVVKLDDREAITDSMGNYIFEDVQPGDYELTVTHTGFLGYETEIAISDDYEVPAIELLKQRFNICGVVELNDSEFREGTTVVLDETDTLSTDIDGRFCFNMVISGPHTLNIIHEGYESRTYTFELVEDVNLTFMLYTLSGIIQGVCSLDESEDYSGTTIIFNEVDTIVTDESGTFSFAGLELYQDYSFRFIHPGYITTDTTVHLDTQMYELNVLLSNLEPPLNLTVISGLDNRVPVMWEPPVATSATLIGYRIYRAFPPFSTPVMIAEKPIWCNGYIDRNVNNYYVYQYMVSAVYDEGESKMSNWEVANPRPNAEHIEALIYDFDNGGTFVNGNGPDFYFDRWLSDYGIIHTKTEQDVSLNDYNLLEYNLVIVSTGIYDMNNRRIRPDDIKLLTNYLTAGGNVYWEGADFGYTYFEQGDEFSRRLFNLFGVIYASDGVSYSEGNVVHLNGSTEFFGRPVDYDYSYRTWADQFLDEYETEETATPIMWSQETPAPSSSNIRMASYIGDGYRTVTSSIYLGAIRDGSYPNTSAYTFGKILQFLIQGLTPVTEKEIKLPSSFSINLYPNPFNAQLSISFALPSNSDVSMDIYDILGDKVYSNNYGNVKSGYFTSYWDGKDNSGKNLPSGIYMISIRYNDTVVNKRAMLLK